MVKLYQQQVIANNWFGNLIFYTKEDAEATLKNEVR